MNTNQESFQKGKEFEDYVEQVLFPAANYELLHKTNSYDQNTERYVGDSRKPDFRFKSKLTGEEFHVEAKYRTNSFQNKYDILSDTQVETFKDIHTGEIPIFIALGYGNIASNPEYISLVPYHSFNEKHIAVNEAFQLQIEKQAVDSSYISSIFPRVDVELDNEGTDKKLDSEPENQNIKPKTKLLNFKTIGVAATFLIIAILFINSISSNSSKDKLEERVHTYYELLDANKINELSEYISPNVHSWYDLKNPTIEQVRANIKNYRDKYPFTITEVDWSTFKVIEQENDEFYATYSMEYKVKSKMNAPYRSYDLDIITVWDNDMKLISASEVKR